MGIQKTFLRFNGIHGKLLALTLGVSIISVLLVSFVILQDFERSLIQRVEESTINSADQLVSQIESQFEPIEQSVAIVSSISTIRTLDQSKMIAEIKRDEMNLFFSITEKLAVLDSSGQELVTNRLSTTLKNRKNELTLNSYTDRWTSVYYANNIMWKYDLPHTSIVQYFQGYNAPGFVVADISLRRLWSVADSRKIGQSGFAYIVTREGVLVSHPDKRKIQHLRKDSLARQIFIASAPVKAIIDGSGSEYLRYNEDGVDYFAVCRIMPQQNIGIIIQVPLKEITAEVDNALNVLILIVIAIVIIATLITLVVTKKLVTPIKQITDATRQIADGNLKSEVRIKTGNDELGYLAQNVEFMRSKLKNYTDDLEFLVEEKIQQLKEIMDNIYQGLFTINLDGSINPECSKQTTEILEIEQFQNTSLTEIFRLTDQELKDFMSWLELVKEKHGKMRWSKLQKLLSLTEVEIEHDDESVKYVDLNFQPLFDQKTGVLNKIMVLARDVSEDIEVENRIEIEREKNEREVQTIIALVKNSRSIINDFLTDSHKRVRFILSELSQFKDDYKASVWMDELHTIKGNAGSLGFVDVSLYAHTSEEILHTFKIGSLSREDMVSDFREGVEELVESMDKLEQLFRLLFKPEEEYIDVSKSKVSRIMGAIGTLRNGFNEDLYQDLLKLCTTMQYKSPHFLTKKYHDLAEKFYNRLQVPAKLEVVSSDIELHPDTFSRYDDALVQLIKNAFDHGCEGKTEGSFVVKLVYNLQIDEEQFIVKDNGIGIDPEQIAQKALEQKLIVPEDLDRLSDKEKVNLIFLQDLSQKEEVSITSGRGVGMSVVARNVKRLGGTIDLSSAKGEGAVFTIRAPRLSV
ncbi:MAG: ATP-binding protein [Fibrobacterales bacterium]